MVIGRIVFLLLLCTFTFTGLFASENTIVVTQNEFVYGGSKVLSYSGEQNDWNYESVILKLYQFTPFKADVNSGVPTTVVSWAYFELSNPDNLELWMNTGSCRLTEIRVFRLDENNKAIDTVISGLGAGIDYRPNWTSKLILPILKNHQKSGRFLIAYYAHGGLNETSFSFGTRDRLADEAHKGNVYSLMYTGLCLLLIFYNLILAWSIKEKIYLLYSLYVIIIFFSATFAVHFPMIGIFIGEQNAQDYVSVWLTFMPLLMVLFTKELFNLKESSPFWLRLLWFGYGIMVLNGISATFLPLNIPTGFTMVLLTIFYGLCSLVGFDQIKKRHPLAWLYFITWVLVLIGLILYFLTAQLSLFNNELFYYINYVTASAEAILFSVALGWRYQLIVKQEKKTSILLTKKNEALFMANESLDSFNYHVSHDLKTVLANTDGLNRMIKKYTLKEKPEKVVEISNKLDKVISKGQETIKGFLSLAEAKKVEKKELEVIEFEKAFNELISNNGLENIEVFYDVKEFDSIRINNTAFNSIFLNLLTNSIKYTKNSPQVHIALKEKSQTIEIIYSDNGIGVDLEKNGSLLFSPFRRVENDLKKEGSGVGLFLVKKIINDYGGEIMPQSALEEGLTFTISLPKDMMVKNV